MILLNLLTLLFLDIEKTDQNWYTALTSHLTAEQQKTLQEIILLADQRKAALESKRIEQSGGKYCLYIRYADISKFVS